MTDEKKNTLEKLSDKEQEEIIKLTEKVLKTLSISVENIDIITEQVWRKPSPTNNSKSLKISLPAFMINSLFNDYNQHNKEKVFIYEFKPCKALLIFHTPTVLKSILNDKELNKKLYVRSVTATSKYQKNNIVYTYSFSLPSKLTCNQNKYNLSLIVTPKSNFILITFKNSS